MNYVKRFVQDVGSRALCGVSGANEPPHGFYPCLSDLPAPFVKHHTYVVLYLCVGLCTRFGEDDATLQLEEKMWARMQKDRNQRSRSGGIFNLGDDGGPGEVLTHRGQALGKNDEDGVGAKDDEDDDLNAEVVDQLHFGGNGSADSRATHPQVRSKGYMRFVLLTDIDMR